MIYTDTMLRAEAVRAIRQSGKKARCKGFHLNIDGVTVVLVALGERTDLPGQGFTVNVAI
jgi:hypothetical protein